MSEIYVQREGQEWGPFTTEELQGQVEAGVFTREDLFWTDGMDDWQPLGTVIEAVPIDETQETIAESPPQEIPVYYDAEGILVTSDEVDVEDDVLPLAEVTRAEAQIERIHRAKPIILSVVFGVAIVCLALVELPRTTFTHWALWGAALAALFFIWLRSAYTAFRSARSMVVIDFRNGNERIIQAAPAAARKLSEAINQALHDYRRHHPTGAVY